MTIIKTRHVLHTLFSALLLLAIVTLGLPAGVKASEHEELEAQIQAKNQELQKLSAQIQQTQGQIQTLQSQGATLEQAIQAIDAQIDQVNYGIRSSEISIEKLALELESLGYTLEEVTREVEAKENAVGQILRRVQQKDSEGLLEVILKNDTLADSVFEIQSLRDIQNNLSVSVAELTALGERLRATISQTEEKKGSLEEENITLKNRKLILADQQEEKDRLLAETKNQEGLYQQRLAELRKEQQTILDEISRIEDQLKARFDPSAVPSKRPELFAWPLKLKTDGGVGIITQNYGETAYSTQFYKGRPHNGMDIGAPMGTEVYAAADGRVVRVDYNGYYYQYGRYILIDHGNNLTTLYAHLSQSAVSAGQTVSKGQLIGFVGNTGFVTGPHLHFGAYATPEGGWREVASRDQGGLISLPPATGLVPIGVTLNPLQYL